MDYFKNVAFDCSLSFTTAQVQNLPKTQSEADILTEYFYFLNLPLDINNYGRKVTKMKSMLKIHTYQNHLQGF